ncbi:cupin domain-containing protein [Desulfospira joergensenii]|uniref:cupin domain-containing protein n=1 Tax=Desulfospira joergensenii TaxID=53329 RepID=UPI0003B41D8F|nr:cupin domain-containing protein [Desulfospira joergensenii]
MLALIEKYELSPHPEGGYYREVYRSGQTVESGPAGSDRSAVTHIYFLLEGKEISRFHRVIHDEIWNFYQGDPIKIILCDKKGIREEIIGPGAHVCVVPAGTWQAAEPMGEYGLVGCTVAPGFDFKDFSFLADTPEELERFRASHEKYKRYL